MTAKETLVRELTTVRKFHDAHKKDLRSKNKHAQRFERTARRLDAEIAQALGSSTSRTSR